MQKILRLSLGLKSIVWRFLSKANNAMSTLETLPFDNSALRRLPLDAVEKNYVRSVAGACFSKVMPTPVDNPVTIAYSTSAMALLDLPVSEFEREDFATYFSGNKLLPGSEPAAHCYCGHQFGLFAGQLGDGAAMYLGEVVNSKHERWEIQLKGAGLTPYSRRADGRKVLRSSVREFLCSEGMHHLGIPTTRAGSCVTSDSLVVRDIFYNGQYIKEKCTIVLRIAPTFLRFGSFEIFKTLERRSMNIGPSFGRSELLHAMLDYAVETFFPEIHAAHNNNNEEKYAEFFKEVVRRTARMVALWQCVGFCHGVLNTDNMSILGLTIDYGPFGFLDMYDPDHLCNSSDDSGRYSYCRQPAMCRWNLQKFAEAIEKALPLSVSTPLLDLFDTEFKSVYLHKMRQKLGLIRKELEGDSELIEKLFNTMEITGADFTRTFLCLCDLQLPGSPDYKNSYDAVMSKLLKVCYPLKSLITALSDRMENRNLQMLLLLTRSDPGMAEQLATAGMDLNKLYYKLDRTEVLEKMTPEQKTAEDVVHWRKWIDMYVERLKMECDGLTDPEMLKVIQYERVFTMRRTNPRFILRNYIGQNAIDKAESGDYSEVKRVLKRLENPFDEDVEDQPMDMPQSSEVVETMDASGSQEMTDLSKTIEDELSPDWALRLKIT